MAYEAPYELTKLDIAAFRHADYIVAWLDRNGVVGSRFHAVKRAEKTDKNPFAVDVAHEIAAPIQVINDWKRHGTKWSCVESVSLYRSQACQASSILATLRVGDAIALQFYPDGHSHENLRSAGFHGDLFNLLVYRKGALAATFTLSQSICEDNSARMCRTVAKEYSLA